MIAFLSALSLRFKLWGLAALGVLITVGYLYTRWKIAANKAVSATAKANALEATRTAEKRVASKRLELSIKQRQVREQIAARKIRDGLEDQGWGP